MIPYVSTRKLAHELVALLGKRLDGVTVAEHTPRLDAPYKLLVIEPMPSSSITSVTRYVRLQLTVSVITEALTGDFNEAAEIFDDACNVLATCPGRIVHCEVDSGPIRTPDSNGAIAAYGVLLLHVTN